MHFSPPAPARDQHVTFRVTQSELEFLDGLTDEHGLSRAQLIREVFAGRVDVSDRPAPSGPTTDVELS